MDLRRPRVAVHLAQLQRRLHPRALRERRVSDHVPERLPAVWESRSKHARSAAGARRHLAAPGADQHAPLRLELLVGLALRVVANNVDVDVAAQVELLRPEHGHFGRCSVRQFTWQV